jgi:hypothetical protein
MEIVHGYVCKTCCDVDLAKKGINPASPQDDVHNPKSPNYGKTEDPQHPGKPKTDGVKASPAVTFGGVFAQVGGAANAGAPSATPSAAYRPYAPGSLTNITA